MRRYFLPLLAIFSLLALPLSLAVYGADKPAHGKDYDPQFVKKAYLGSMAEVQLGQLAATNAQHEQVKRFGERMVADHSQANKDLTSAAKAWDPNYTLPADLDEHHKKTVDKLSKLQGDKFDRAYMELMVSDHHKDVNEYKEATQKLSHEQLKEYATKTLPVLEQHYKLAVDTQKALLGTAHEK